MKAVIIGASKEALHTIEKAHEHGLIVTALDGNPKAAGLEAADKALVVDISDEKAAVLAAEGEQPDFLLTVPIGRYLTTAGAVNDALKLPGISRQTASLCTDKLRFHQKLQAENLRECCCYGVGKKQDELWGDEILKRIEAESLPLSFPAILKPRFGSGSRGIHMVENMEELKGALLEMGEESCVLEECVPGAEYGVDGAVAGNEFQMILLRKKENTPLPVRQAVAYFSVLPNDPVYGQIQEYVKNIAACLELKECLFHADIIKGEKGLFVIELSARPSGHNLHNLFTPLCTGVDMAEEYIKYRMGKDYSFRPQETKSMMIHYFDLEGKVKQVPEEEWVRQNLKSTTEEISLSRWECHIREGEVLGPVLDGHSIMGRGYFILEGADQEEMLLQAEKIKGLFF